MNGPGIHYTLEQIPPGKAGTDATLRRMGELVTAGLHGQFCRLVCHRILASHGVPGTDQQQIARTLFKWVRRHVRYVRDPVGLETVQDPAVTIRLGSGDCDDSAVLLATLAQTAGLQVRFVVVGPSVNQAVHVYTQLLVGGRWLNADTTTPGDLGKPDPKLAAVTFYNTRGEQMSGIGEAMRATPLTPQAAYQVAYAAAKKQIRDNWRDGLINRQDIQGYVAAIDNGNSPLRGTFGDAAIRQAAIDVLEEKNARGEASPKGELSGMGDVGFFLGSVVKAVGKAVGWAAKAVTGGTGQVVIQPPVINIPKIETSVSPDSARAGVGAFLSNPIVLVGGVLALILLMRK